MVEMRVDLLADSKVGSKVPRKAGSKVERRAHSKADSRVQTMVLQTAVWMVDLSADSKAD